MALVLRAAAASLKKASSRMDDFADGAKHRSKQTA